MTERTPNGAPESDPDLFRQFFDRSIDLHAIIDPDANIVAVNEAWQLVLGYPLDELRTIPVLELVHPADRDSAIRELGALAQGSATISFECRVRTRDENYRWLHFSAVSEGGLIYVTARDVGVRKAADEELYLLHTLIRALSQAEDFESALEALLRETCRVAGWDVGEVWLMDDRNRLVRSPAWYGARDDLSAFRSPGSVGTFKPGEGLVGRAWASQEPVWNSNVLDDPSFTRREEAERHGLRTGVAVPVLAGEDVVAVLDFFAHEERDLDERFVELISTIAAQLGMIVRRRHAEDQLAGMAEEFRQQSLLDHLTGLPNRRGFVTRADQELRHARRESREMTFLYIDLDGMKAINDTHGHHEGDRALRDAADLLRATFRESDVLGRVGGDEFCVLIDGGPDAQRVVLTRLQGLLHALNIGSDRPYELTFSVGSAAALAADHPALEDLMREADRSMYRMKDGRGD